MQMLTYPLFEGRFVNRWLVTPPREQPVLFEPVTLDENFLELLKTGKGIAWENPGKTGFVRDRRA